ncbi:hypothetical protein A0256_19360 [Mucilaginibacter sp. PAMC 26640]|nr:hypothetical protein A0256_19360 [Mucilaginibacter sp. PAMC 26640]
MSKVFTIAEGLENMGALRTGGQGSVYKGRRTGFIYSAIKLIPTPIYAENIADDKNYRNFQSEVAKLQKVNEFPNPNIVKILGWGLTESGSFPFIEMEYIDGPDLGELLHTPNDKIFTIKELLKVADQLAYALAHCHKLGVKHGDIKSNNIKYNIHSGNYVLLDFGLAIMTEEQRRSSMRTAGAVEFMAPEQYDGKMLLQTDVYSFGIILYELLAGEVPFPLDNEGQNGRNTIMLQHMNAPIPDLLEKRKGNMPAGWSAEQIDRETSVPEWLVKLIYKCLQKNPGDRYPNGDALYKSLALHQTQFGNTLSVDLPVTRNVSVKSAELTNDHSEASKIQISKFVFWGLLLSFGILLALTVFAVLLYKHHPFALKIYSHSLSIFRSIFGKSQSPLKR